MLDVQVNATVISNHNITRNHAVFCHTCCPTKMEFVLGNVFVKTKNAIQFRVLIMHGNESINSLSQVKSLFQALAALKGNTVIRKAEGPLYQQCLEVRQMLTIKIFANCGIGIDVNVLFSRAGQYL